MIFFRRSPSGGCFFPPGAVAVKKRPTPAIRATCRGLPAGRSANGRRHGGRANGRGEGRQRTLVRRPAGASVCHGRGYRRKCGHKGGRRKSPVAGAARFLTGAARRVRQPRRRQPAAGRFFAFLGLVCLPWSGGHIACRMAGAGTIVGICTHLTTRLHFT